MTYDLAILGGRLYDGTGAAARRADVGVSGDTVSKVGRISRREASEVLDATGLVVAPGFIDVHTHSDLTLLACRRGDGYFACPRCHGTARDTKFAVLHFGE